MTRALFLFLQRMVIFTDKSCDFIRDSQKLFPLLAVQRYWEPAQTIYRKCAFFAYS